MTCDDVDRTACPLRSAEWFAPRDLPGFIHRSTLTPVGLGRQELDGRPVIGIANSWSDYNPCNAGLKQLVEHVKRGVQEAGGVAFEFPTISLSENLIKPTAMMFRNLMAMDVEESIRGYPMDAVVLLGGCDKTVPAQVMGAASVNLPTLCFGAGPATPPVVDGAELGGGHAVWQFVDKLRAGSTSSDLDALESCVMSTVGHCAEMGTASTMAALMEALGLALPGTALIPATDGRRANAAAAAGRAAVTMARQGSPTIRELLTPEAFDNAIALLMALGGSTNAIVHLLAIARRVGVSLQLKRFDEISAQVPLIADVRPSGAHLVSRLHGAGGVPAVLAELKSWLHLDALTVTGRTLGTELDAAKPADGQVIRRAAAPLSRSGGIVVVHGSLAPDGAVLKVSAASPELFEHRGRALVFESIEELAGTIDDPELEVDASTVLVLRNAGPRGGPGMPEWGMLPIPKRLLAAGVTDMVRVSDARMSGTAYGTAILHVSPEAAVGGPLALVRTGDEIELSVAGRRLDLLVDEAELVRRRGGLREFAGPRRGWAALFDQHVLQAHEGCDLDILTATEEPPVSRPSGLFRGWIGGW
ncbi:dihydroxy-acid dehydratase [Kribbella solani]|uniref:Dihydroxy-acid dehydratase n=1 Tax=Kribbella solani TaxID=236067 RepID=A0A841DUQ3_9ACTN|nr:dihydroxy-acid dehydratase [Kribbella solani]MBB5980007.1 dihydroxy-acid dehydratase [Kribbella solani]